MSSSARHQPHPVQFATVPHRAERTKKRVTRATFLGPPFKLSKEAAMSWLRNCAPEKFAELLAGRYTKTEFRKTAACILDLLEVTLSDEG